jgi:hypothetical protein
MSLVVVVLKVKLCSFLEVEQVDVNGQLHYTLRPLLPIVQTARWAKTLTLIILLTELSQVA